MKETLSSIAARLGLSPSTISRVLGGKAEMYRIPPATVESVLMEVKRCGYRPPKYAQTLRNDGTKCIGLLVPSISNPYFAEIASYIIEEAHLHNYTTIVVNTLEDENREVKGIDTLLAKNVEGIIAAPCGKSPVLLERISSESTPVVLVDRYYEQTSLPYVTANNYMGGYRGTRKLLECGHTDIACIQGAKNSMPNKRRVEGFLAALADAGLEGKGRIVGNNYSIQNGYFETKILLNEERPPSAIFALSNTILLGVLKAIRETSFRIPEDISVISYDDYLFLDYTTPPITRIGQPTEDMARLAAKILFDNIEGGKYMNNTMQLTPVIIHGDSVANRAVKQP